MMDKLEGVDINKTIKLDREIIIDKILELHFKDKQTLDWVKLLYELGDLEELMDILNISKSDILGIMKYRRLLHRQGKYKISFIELNTAYSNNQLNKVHTLFERMFLEPITDSQLDFITKRINKKDGGLEVLYTNHMLNKERRILNVALTL